MLERLREEIWQLHLELVKNNLVKWTSGNVSGRDPETGLVVIRPSGVRYEELRPDNLIIVDLDGRQIEGELLPSVDCITHLYIHRHRPDINGIVHTHSPYATAFAAVGQSIPVVLTEIADLFGGPIPCGEYARIGGEEIGAEVIRSIENSPAILLKNHGVFAIGETPTAAMKAAVMVENAAKIVFLAKQLGTPEELSPAEVECANRRYIEKYGQRAR